VVRDLLLGALVAASILIASAFDYDDAVEQERLIAERCQQQHVGCNPTRRPQ
jgi:hypothetical protein